MASRTLSTLVVLVLIACAAIFIGMSAAYPSSSHSGQANFNASLSGNSTNSSSSSAAGSFSQSAALRYTRGTSTSSSQATSTHASSTTTQTTSTSSENRGGRPTRTSGGTSSSTTSTTTSSSKITSQTTISSATLSGQIVSTNWNPYADFYNFLNYGLFDDGGDCFGFASTAILYYMHYSIGDQTYPHYPEPTDSVASLPGETDSNVLSQSTFPIYIHQTYDSDNLAYIPSDEASQAQVVMESIQKGTPVLLIIGPTQFHAIVAWGYTQSSDGSVTLYVSDPNFGNQSRYAYYSNGKFTYTGTYTWTTFYPISPEILQWNWFSSTNLVQTVNATNEYYNYVFSSIPITITSQSGTAYFSLPGDTLSFSNSISGAVGFEEGSIQIYGIPKEVPFTISDPGETSAMITIVIPQNRSSIIGYQLSSSSSAPLNMSIVPGTNRLNLTTSTDLSVSVSFFSAGEKTHSILNAAPIPVSSSQTAIFSVPDWSNLNNTQAAPNLQVLKSDGVLVTSHTLTNVSTELSTTWNVSYLVVPLVIVAAIAVFGLLVFVTGRKRQPERAARSSK